MKAVKNLLSLSFFSAIVFSHQARAMSSMDDDPCKTYYDAEKTKLKEVFECKTSYQVVMNPNGQSEVKMQPTGIKHGLYIMYDVNGKQLLTGYFADNVRTGTWKYYDAKGKVIKTEVYENGKLKKA